jgi:hypothetical protein
MVRVLIRSIADCAFGVVQRAQIATLHAQRKVALLSSTPAEIVVPTDDARPEGF